MISRVSGWSVDENDMLTSWLSIVPLIVINALIIIYELVLG